MWLRRVPPHARPPPRELECYPKCRRTTALTCSKEHAKGLGSALIWHLTNGQFVQLLDCLVACKPTGVQVLAARAHAASANPVVGLRKFRNQSRYNVYMSRTRYFGRNLSMLMRK